MIMMHERYLISQLCIVIYFEKHGHGYGRSPHFLNSLFSDDFMLAD
jgi:hypothetical protein